MEYLFYYILPAPNKISGECEKMTQMCMHFKTKTDVAQNLINNFFSKWLSEDLSIGKILNGKKYGGMGLISEKREALYVELDKRAEAATNNFSSI